MRREKILKICLNHILTNDIEYIPKEDKSWLFVAADFSEGELEVDKFCLRFKNADVAKQFKEALDKSLKKETSTGTLLRSLFLLYLYISIVFFNYRSSRKYRKRFRC